MPTRSPHRSPRTTAPINYSGLAPHTPYITSWSEEQELPYELIERPGRGIGYVDETPYDRDAHGVLWKRTPHRPGHGHPEFKTIHPLRQRRAMQRLLCNVCGRPSDQNEDGILWLIRDDGRRWRGWPNRSAETEPPVCPRCVRVAPRLCPALRDRAVALRVGRAPVSGVRGQLFSRDRNNEHELVPTDVATLPYGDPDTRRILAGRLIRELLDCAILPLEEACRNSSAS